MRGLEVLTDANAPLAMDPPRSQQDAALFLHETGFRNALVLAFGKGRFSLRDLWRERPGNHAWPALYEGVGAARWPERAWAERMRRELMRLPGVEPAPGPRGGESWRVSPVVAEQIIGKREDAKAAQAAKNSPQRTAAAALSSRFATITLDEAAQRVEARYPHVELAPRQEWGELRPVHLDTIVADWSRTHRYAGLRVVDGAITCDWQHAGKLAHVLAQLDDLVAHFIEAAAKHHQARLAALAPYRTAAVGSAAVPARPRRRRYHATERPYPKGASSWTSRLKE